MGFAVYEDAIAHDCGVTRWSGYGVPAECDMPGCTKRIDRGMGYRCESADRLIDEDDDDPEFEDGCGLQFCSEHLDHGVHGDDVSPKPDLPVWEAFMLLDESWYTWRTQNPQKVEQMKARLTTADYDRARQEMASA